MLKYDTVCYNFVHYAIVISNIASTSINPLMLSRFFVYPWCSVCVRARVRVRVRVDQLYNIYLFKF